MLSALEEHDKDPEKIDDVEVELKSSGDVLFRTQHNFLVLSTDDHLRIQNEELEKTTSHITVGRRDSPDRPTQSV